MGMTASHSFSRGSIINSSCFATVFSSHKSVEAVYLNRGAPKVVECFHPPLLSRERVDLPARDISTHEVCMTPLLTLLAIVLCLEQIVETAQKIIANWRNSSRINVCLQGLD